jgi:hypothetical protein
MRPERRYEAALMTAALAEPLFELPSPYIFVRLDEAGYCLSEGPLQLGDDHQAFAHARRTLEAGAMLVAVYQDGHKVAMMAKLC